MQAKMIVSDPRIARMIREQCIGVDVKAGVDCIALTVGETNGFSDLFEIQQFTSAVYIALCMRNGYLPQHHPMEIVAGIGS